MISYRHPLILFIAILSFVLLCNSPATTVPENTSNPYSIYDNTPCSELAGSQYVPVTLDTILCAGYDSEGTVYLIDKSDHRFRCFISRNDTLQRHNVSGSSVSGEEYYFISTGSGNQIIFHNDDNEWSDIYLLEGIRCEKCDSILFASVDKTTRENPQEQMASGWSAVVEYLDNDVPESRKLSAAATAEIATMAVRNFPPAIHIEYIARQQNDRYLLVTRAEQDWNGDFVVHYGMPESMQLREYVNSMLATDGGSTWIDYLLDGKVATAVFRVAFEDTAFIPGPAYNIIDGDTLELERLSVDTATMRMLGFGCWAEK